VSMRLQATRATSRCPESHQAEADADPRPSSIATTAAVSSRRRGLDWFIGKSPWLAALQFVVSLLRVT